MSSVYFASVPMPQPIGGLQVLADHVAFLRNEGIDALLWYPETPGITPFVRTEAPVVYASRLEFSADDLIVVPEPAVRPGYDPAPLARKVIFNQNHFFTLVQWRDETPYPGWRLEPDVWVVSRESEKVLARLSPDSQPRLIPNHVDPDLFASRRRLRPSIAWMPRKRPHESSLISKLLREDKRSAGMELREISGASRDEVVEMISTSTVFLSLAHTESFGLPIAEALTAGCLVVGYSGGGGEHLFEAPGAWLVPDQRPLLLVDKAFDLLADPALQRLGQANREWVLSHYPRETTREALLSAVHAAFERPGGAGMATHPLVGIEHVDHSLMTWGA
jgi:glycosyltransferase involved in cell wall biosynthesis